MPVPENVKPGDRNFSALFNTLAAAVNKALSTAETRTVDDGVDIEFGTGAGSRLGATTSQKIGFFGATPVNRRSATSDIGTILAELGLRASGSAYPLTTSGVVSMNGQRRQATAAITTSTTLTTSSVSDQTITASSAAINVTLPATTTAGIVFRFLRLDATAQVVRILGTINGESGYTLTGQYSVVEVKSTTTSGVWQVWASR